MAKKQILWTGDNLREVIEFTGLHPRFDEWFNEDNTVKVEVL